MKVLFESDFVSQHVKVSSTLYIRKPGRRSPRPVLITASRRQGVTADNTFLMQLNGIQSRTIAETLRHYEVYVKDVTSKPKLSKDEFLIRDMVGMNCYMLSDYDAVCTGAGTGAVVTNKAQSVEGNMSGPRPVGIVAGVVPADELCDGAAAAQLMHAQIEIQLVTSAADPIKEEETQQISTVSVRSALRQSLIGRKKNVDVSSSRYGQSVRKLPNCKKATLQYCLVPLVRSIVPVVDAARRCIFLDPPAGLLQLTYELPDKLGPVRGFLPQHIAYLTEEHRQYLHARTTVT